jgi:DNA-binding NarL/FixJ family response regulator
MDGTRTTIVILDQHEVARRGLRTLFHAQPGLRVIAECATAPDAIACVTRFRPDVLVMDAVLPGVGGSATCRRIREQAPAVRVVLLVPRADADAVVAGLRAGATGVVSTRASLDEICRAVRAAAAGAPLLDAPATAALLEHVRCQRDGDAQGEALTELERRALGLVVEGRTNKEIAQALALSEKTVKGHLARAFAKLHVTRRAQAAVRFAGAERSA